MSEPIRYGYVVGSGFSGSTLLAMALGSHPDIATIGEMGPTAAWAGTGLSCSCGQPIDSCEFLTEAARLAGPDIAVDGGSLRFQRSESASVQRLLSGHLGSARVDRLRDRVVPRLPGVAQQVAQTLANTEAFARSVLALAQAKVFVDASKSRTHLAALSQSTQLDLRVIHLVRDPRGFGRSAAKNSQIGAQKAARAWTREQQAIEHWLEQHTHLPQTQVRYEDLCQEPQSTLWDLHRFLDLEPVAPPEVLHPNKQHLIGNRMRLQPQIRIRLDEAWRTDLAPADQSVLEREAWPTAERYGYTR